MHHSSDFFFFYDSAESETETPRKRRGAVWNSKKRNGSKQKGPGRKEKKGQTRIKQTNPGRDRVQKSKYTNWRGMNTQSTKERGKHIDSISLCCSRIIFATESIFRAICRGSVSYKTLILETAGQVLHWVFLTRDHSRLNNTNWCLYAFTMLSKWFIKHLIVY